MKKYLPILSIDKYGVLYMIKRKSGFTLMEIMIVIIVIAVLASVAGPMIGNITDQGRASATRSKMSNLKSALIAFQGDVGRFPSSCANVGHKDGFCQVHVMCTESEVNNVLVCNAYNLGMKNYNRKWKGPYMDSDPKDFMYDSWGNPIAYVRYGKNLYLWSSGPNGEFYGADADAAFKAQSNDEVEECDDILISVGKFKKSVN